MNVKSGQLCRVVNPTSPCYGMVVRVTVLDELSTVLAWRYEGEFIRVPGRPGKFVRSFFDRSLRPLADPGPEEIDESLHWTDAPEGVDLIEYQEPQTT